MGPPPYSDIGKAARDVLRKNFEFGMRFLSYKGKEGNYEYTGRIDNAFRYKNMYGSFESTLFFNKYAVEIKEKWNSKGSISAEVSTKNQLIEGLTHKIRTLYDINTKYQDYLVGISMGYKVNKEKLEPVDVAFAYSISDFGFHGVITDWARTFTAGVYQRLSNTLEYAAETTWNRNDSTHTWAIGCQYALDSRKRNLVKLKLDSCQRVSISLKNQLKEGVNFCVCGLFNDAEETQVGFGVEIE
ncbi:unnamed protein product [Hymenolepis diminuta]|uniref:Voltage-dependent anion-selective channel protein 3 n=1 Tax=Hymenolepis diminuta TaxID=6216 RepID=A0A0R3S7M8_HYMDI|nr:unnamed protein product [Hymenolepis diminuta]